MSPKTRVQILLEPDQLAALRRIQARTLAPVAAQIRQAVDTWLAGTDVSALDWEQRKHERLLAA